MRTRSPIRWGIMGTGWVAQRFMADVSSLSGATLAAVGSRSKERATEVSRRFGVARAHDSYEGVARDADVDVVYVATEHHEHVEHCLLALRSGKHVLCEKPFATSSEAATKVVEEARRRGLFCMEAMWTRFLPAALSAKRLVDAGRIGVASWLSADFGIPVEEVGPNRLFDPLRGGGAMLDRGVYALSLAVSLFGKPVEVFAVARRAASGVDETVSAVIKFPEERIAVLSASLGAFSANEMVVAGTTGRLRVHSPLWRPERISIDAAPRSTAGARSDLRANSWREAGKRLAGRVRAYLPVDLLRTERLSYPVYGYGYRYEALEVERCLREGLKESPLMPLGETLVVIEALDRIRRAIT